MGRCAALLADDPAALRGLWLERFPGHDGIFLELGCGKGRFTAELAATVPEKLYLALEKVPDGAVLERAPTGREYAVRRMEVVGCGSGRMWVPPSQSQRTPDCQWIRFVWSIPAALAGARPGDVFPAVVVFDDYATHWMGGKFALRCGGKGRHADCDFCFSIVAGTGRGRPAASRSVPAGRRTPPEASDGSPGGAVFARPLTGTPVYATNAPPWSDGTIQPPADMLQAGTQVRILGRIPPCFFLVRYAGPKGETREGLVYESFFPSNAVPPEAAERP